MQALAVFGKRRSALRNSAVNIAVPIPSFCLPFSILHPHSPPQSSIPDFRFFLHSSRHPSPVTFFICFQAANMVYYAHCAGKNAGRVDPDSLCKHSLRPMPSATRPVNSARPSSPTPPWSPFAPVSTLSWPTNRPAASMNPPPNGDRLTNRAGI